MHEVKLDKSFLDQQLKIDGYQLPPFKRDTDKHWGGKVAFVKEGLIVNRIKEFKLNKSETICLELIIFNKNGLLCTHTGLQMKQTRKSSLNSW